MSNEEQERRWSQAFRLDDFPSALSYEQFLKEFSAYTRKVVVWHFVNSGINLSNVEDALQEILVAVHTHRHKWDANRPLIPWLQAIIRYKTIDIMRRLQRPSEQMLYTSEATDTIDYVIQHAPLSLEESTDLEAAINELPEIDQTIIRKIALEGFSYGELSPQLKRKEGTIRVMFHRIIKKLRDKNDTYGD